MSTVTVKPIKNSQTAPPQVNVRECLRALATPILDLKGVGPKRAEQLAAAGLRSVEDLIYHLPFRYEDRRRLNKINTAALGQEASFIGELISLQNRYVPRRRMQMLTAMLRDDTGALDLLWYRAPSFLVNGLAKGQTLLVHGKLDRGMEGRLRIVHPDFEVVDAGEDIALQRILPIYERPGGLALSFLRRLLAHALREYAGYLPNRLPAVVAARQCLLELPTAVTELHQPPVDADVEALNEAASIAHRSIVFEELFFLQLGLGLRRRARLTSAGIELPHGKGALSARMRGTLPFALTGAQERVLNEIEADLAQPAPMQRLVQGDVGSGKTIVAWLASLDVIERGRQAVWMAPTEMLAEQHYRSLQKYADALGISSTLLTASTPARERKVMLDRIAKHQIQFIVGTHALIQADVRAPHMGLGVIDEQHRFGVLQRLSLQKLVGGDSKAREAHMLLMSATPIPRSLAMVLYGDMEVSYLDEMPPGRTPIMTKVFAERERKALYSLVLEEVQRGHQAFVVLPLVEASEQLQQVRDATQMAEKMRQTMFKDFRVGLAHGRMKSDERDAVMRDFRDGQLAVLVATTVIEVGIDIPNATVIVVEHAERFGLSQLHQLRGRVGRGSVPSFCFLINYGTKNSAACERLHVMETENDGFKIAEADLRLRGPGELLGTRQAGLADFRLASLTRDARLLIEARKEALAWLEKDPQLKSKESAGMRAILNHRWGQRLQLGVVG